MAIDTAADRGPHAAGSAQVLVCGEALIDLTPRPNGGAEDYLAHPGGGPFNTAVALGRLGVATGFCSRLSDDGFGRRLRDRLASAGVDLSTTAETSDPTSLAVVSLNERGEADYTFYVEGTADRGLRVEDLPAELDPTVEALHFGTLSLVLEPGASTYEALMQREHGRRLLALDPNCRPMLIDDRTSYVARLERWIGLVDLVKVSTADLTWLYPALDRSSVAERWHGLGVRLVVVTDGAAGAVATTSGGRRRHVGTPTVEVVDTIGAGDTFNAGLLGWLAEHDRLSGAAIDALDDDDLDRLLRFAATAAAINCSRPGADPPWRSELDRW